MSAPRTPRSRGHTPLLPTRQLKSLQRCLQEPPRASGISGSRWSVARINRLLRKRYGIQLSSRHALRRIRDAGIRVKLTRAREPSLNARAQAQLKRMLRRSPPRAADSLHERWSRAEIAQWIERRFKRRFTLGYVGRLVRRLRGRGLQCAPVRRLTRDQAAGLRRLLLPRRKSITALPRMTRSQIARLIESHFGVRYHPQSIPGVLKRWRIGYDMAPTSRGDARPSSLQLAELSAALHDTPRAFGIPAARWEQRYIAQFIAEKFELKYPKHGLYRRLSRWGISVPSPASAGGACSLTELQRHELARVLSLSPTSSGYTDAHWSRALAARFILDHFNVRYRPTSIAHLLRRNGLRLHSTPKTSGDIAYASDHNSDSPLSNASLSIS